MRRTAKRGEAFSAAGDSDSGWGEAAVERSSSGPRQRCIGRRRDVADHRPESAFALPFIFARKPLVEPPEETLPSQFSPRTFPFSLPASSETGQGGAAEIAVVADLLVARSLSGDLPYRWSSYGDIWQELLRDHSVERAR